MKITKQLINRLQNRASKSIARYKVSAIGFDHKGNIIGTSAAYPRFPRKMGGVHAEEILINQYKGNIKTILICRTGQGGENFLPIHPCDKCKKLADKYNIKIICLHELI